MKTVQMNRDFDYRATSQNMTAYKKDHTYDRVPNAAADAIVAAGAGTVLGENVAAGAGTVLGENGEDEDTGTEKSRRNRRA